MPRVMRFSRFLDFVFDQFLAYLAEALPPRRPLPVAATLIREESDMLVYKPVLPPPGAPDVVTRELTYVVDGGAPEVVDVAEGTEIAVNDGATVTLTLVDVDDAGNRSAPSEPYTFTASDTLPPPQPGQPGAELLREE